MSKLSQLIARVLLGHIFLLAGLSKLGAEAYAGTQGYMESMGVPGILLPLVILLEIGAGIALVAGWQTRLAAIALAGFTIVAAVIFHNNLGDQMQMILFMKNLAIAGGLLLLAVHGAGAYSLDGYLKPGRLAVDH
ncbi:MAG: DoxX family protein [Gammaproteobacteria bacterium]|nr:DoxX family protein [Gammaproteobacteria bacterium]MDH3448589.1 DoxX family protein [Gammaproteobacteria bacterium]